MIRYIYQRDDWPNFHWDTTAIVDQLAAVRNRQGLFLGRMQSLGFRLRDEANLEALTEEVQKSSAIEGESLNREQIRSSIARRLGLDSGTLLPEDRHIEGVVEMLLDATRQFDFPLTAQRMFGWHAALFPTGYSGLLPITVAAWRTDSAGPMQIVSGSIGREHVHYEAPEARLLPVAMDMFLKWFDAPNDYDPVLKAAVAHLWFVTIHPFDDGNGRIARAIADMALARSERTQQRFYSMSAQTLKERAAYYDNLNAAQKGDLDVTGWLVWFLGCLDRAIVGAEGVLEAVFAKARFWDAVAPIAINERQRLMLNRLVDGFEGKLTTVKWSKIAKCSHDTALRDIQDLIEKGILSTERAGGRSTSYSIRAR